RGEVRELAINLHQEAVDRARERLAGEAGAMRRRAGLVEHPFGTLKQWGVDLLCRGKRMAGAETTLSAWAYNFTRTIEVVSMEPLMAVLRGRRCRLEPTGA